MTGHLSNHGLCIAEVCFSLIVKKLGVGCPGPVQDPVHGAGIQGPSVLFLCCHQHEGILYHGPDGGPSLSPHSQVPAVGREQMEKEPL